MKRESVLNKKKTLLFVLFVMLIVGISFGYANLETTLHINGNASIAGVSWNVHFKNLSTDDVNNFTNGGENYARIKDGDDTTVEYSVTLTEPGQTYDFDFYIANDGSIDAKLQQLSIIGPTELSLDYLNYSITGLPAENDVLQPGADNYIHVEVSFEFPTDIEPEALPGEGYSFASEISLHYVQAD